MISMLAFPAVFFVAMMIYAGVGDLCTMRIPNNLILLILGGYVLAVPLADLSLSEVLGSVAVASVLFLFGFLAFTLHCMGGGDVKLLTVTALWLGAANIAPFILYTSIFGAVLTIIIVIFRRLPLPRALAARAWIGRLHSRNSGVPYGVAIAAAGVLVYLRTPWVSAQF